MAELQPLRILEMGYRRADRQAFIIMRTSTRSHLFTRREAKSTPSKQHILHHRVGFAPRWRAAQNLGIAFPVPTDGFGPARGPALEAAGISNPIAEDCLRAVGSCTIATRGSTVVTIIFHP
jgi:hypothetical protein